MPTVVVSTAVSIKTRALKLTWRKREVYIDTDEKSTKEMTK
jgi:hypothetical protein